MKRTTLALSTLALGAALATPAFGQATDAVARGATVTSEFCKDHQAMRDALVVNYWVETHGKAVAPGHFESRPATDKEAIDRLAKIHARLMLALRGNTREEFVPVSAGRPGQLVILKSAPAPSPALVQESLANLVRLCPMHRMLHDQFAMGKPADIKELRKVIDSSAPDGPHGN